MKGGDPLAGSVVMYDVLDEAADGRHCLLGVDELST